MLFHILFFPVNLICHLALMLMHVTSYITATLIDEILSSLPVKR